MKYLIDPQQQSCKVCGRKEKINFNVRNEIWEAIVPPTFQNNVVCLSCFDAFAAIKDIDYSGRIESIYFAGEKNSFKCTIEKLTE